MMKMKSELSDTSSDAVSNPEVLNEWQQHTINFLSSGHVDMEWKYFHFKTRGIVKSRKNWNYNLYSGMGYIVCPLLFSNLLPFLNLEPGGEWLINGTIVVILIGLLIIVYHYSLHSYFKKELIYEPENEFKWTVRSIFWEIVSILRSLTAGTAGIAILFGLKALKLFRKLVDTLYYVILLSVTINFLWILGINIWVQNWSFSIGLIMAIALHVYLYLKLQKWNKKHGNYKLLILRVFNIQSNTNFIFEKIAKYWMHVGAYLTIVDTSFLFLQKKRIWRNFIPIIFFAILITWLTCYVLESVLGIKDQDVNGTILISLIAIASTIHIVYSYKQVTKRFIITKDDLDRCLAQLSNKPLNVLTTFRKRTVSCYDNTWAFVVSEFIQLADTILMDLRGYSEHRKGCQQEVNLLLNLVPVSKVTFVIDADAAFNVTALFSEACSNINSNSPNYNTGCIQINVYVMYLDKEMDYVHSNDIIALLTNSIPIELDSNELTDYA